MALSIFLYNMGTPIGAPYGFFQVYPCRTIQNKRINKPLKTKQNGPII